MTDIRYHEYSRRMEDEERIEDSSRRHKEDDGRRRYSRRMDDEDRTKFLLT